MKNLFKQEILLLSGLLIFMFIYASEVWGARFIEQKIFVLVTSGFLLITTIYRLILIVINLRKISKLNTARFFKLNEILKNQKLHYIIIFLIYVLLIPMLGLFSSSYIFMIIFMIIFGIKNKIVIFVLPALIIAIYYFSLVNYLGIRLPHGIFI